jgi:hypothetical protein
MAIVQLERSGQLGGRSTSSGLKPTTFRLLASCLNQLCYCVLPTLLCMSIIFGYYKLPSEREFFKHHTSCNGSRDSAVGIATRYGLDNRGVRVQVPVGLRIFSSPCRSDWLWGPPSLLYNGYQGSFSGGKVAGV